ncbi:YfkD family protein [Oceanobacillus kapialis]|uniref:YfkD famly protein n=1 Tax=Oceanobacillus kapialis TaxID=481353 RepID=UPI00384C3408
MKKSNVVFLLVTLCVFTLLFPSSGFSKEKKEDFKIPSHVLTISKENTFPNATEDQEVVEPSDLTKELIESLKVKVENPELIKMLNESTINPSPIALGYRGMVFIGRWPLNYESLETTINWEYQPINKNELNNVGGETAQNMNYVQQEQKEVKGALTNKIANPDDIKKMMLLKSKEKTKLPLAYHTVIGKNTKKDNSYSVPTEKHATLDSYAPAVNEKGQVTFGEVYIQLKGSKKALVVKNVTKQGIGAWIPIQDHVSFSYNVR